MNSPDKPYHVVSIVGYDRSGTTFLGKYLDQYEGAFYIGELDRGVDIIKKGLKMKCTCGAGYDTCSVWSHLVKLVAQEEDPGIPQMYDLIYQVTKARVLIDSSKSFAQLKGLSEAFGDRHVLIRLIRNPKGVIYSRMKTRIRRVSRNKHPKPWLAKRTNLLMVYDTIEWSLENVWLENYVKRSGNVLKLTYELLDQTLEREVIPFLATFGMGSNFNSEKQSHILFGNISRFDPLVRAFKIDRAWETGLSVPRRVLIDALSFPVRKLFGYKFN